MNRTTTTATSSSSCEEKEHPVEWGYLLLEDTPVQLEYGEKADKNHCLVPNQWYTLHLGDEENDATIGKHSNDDDGVSTQSYCPSCQFIVQLDSSHVQETVLCLPARQSPFSESSFPSSSNAPSLSHPCAKCRSPADGVVFQHIVQALPGQVEVVQSQVLFLDDSFTRVACYATLALPTMGVDAQGRRALVPHTAKPLSGPWQLLLTLLRSDWNVLDELHLALQDARVTQAIRRSSSSNRTEQQQSLLPSRVTMPSLYERLPASPPFAAALRRRRLDAALAVQSAAGVHRQNESVVVWTQIEEVIWQRHIAPFLTAADVDALRRTCRYWHSGVLRRVVPGLRLALYQHQITSLAWMRQRERRTLVETDCDDAYHQHHYEEHGMDLHRAITAGATVRLQARKAPHQWWRVDTLTGKEHPALHNSLSDGRTVATTPRRRVARGGLLIDDPGLGKTITVLSLILQTAGLTTQVSALSSDVSKNFQEPDDDTLFTSYWTENVPDDFARQDLLKLVNQVDRRAPRGFWSSKEMRRRIDSNIYAANFELFEKDMRRAIMDHKGTEDSDKQLALDLVEISQELVREYKARMLVSAKKSFSNASAKPNSTLASLIEESKRINFIKSLIPSRGSLIVIPSVLMDHWESQIDMYVDMSYLTKKLPLVYSFGGDGISLRAAQDLIRNEKFKPVVFLDRGGTKQLPPADFVAQFLIVITTTSRLAQEWKNGSFQEELERCEDRTTERLYENSIDRASSDACPLLKIHWLRMVIDEGHSMAKAARSSSIQFASWISAERRWAMTGTPTKQGSAALTQVKHLLSFLQHDFFSPRCDGEIVWNRYIARPWNEGRNVDNGRDGGLNRLMTTIGPCRAAGAISAFLRLRSLLLLLMKRHTKRDIAELPLPIENEGYVSLSDVEVKTYNALSAVIASNLLLTSMKEDAVQDSLLHKTQSRHARDALNNLLRVCAGFTKVIPVISEKNRMETLALMKRYALVPHQGPHLQEKIEQFMQRAATDQLTPCDCCGLELSILLVLPCCGGLVCAECMEGQSSNQYMNDQSERWMHMPYDNKKWKQRKTRKYFQKECLLCESKIDVDNLQRLQPGMAFEWQDNLKSEENRKISGEETGTVLFLPNENDINNSPGLSQEVIVRPQVEARRRTKRPGDGHECEYDRFAITGKCIHCLEEHNSCNLLHGRCRTCFRCPRDCPIEETKPRYLLNKCLRLMLGQSAHNDVSRRDEIRRPVKIIVFSQLKKVLNFVGDRLLKRFGTACIAEYWGRYRSSELRKFVHDPECFCMLLGRDGSEGLDLSFVTHIFFLDEIFDKSLAAQTIARAWRMGATGPVEVETIIARDTIEETMKTYEEAKLAGPAQISGVTLTGRKTEVVLKSLKFLTDYFQFRKNPLKRPPKAEDSSCLPPAAKKTKVLSWTLPCLLEHRRGRVVLQSTPTGGEKHDCESRRQFIGSVVGSAALGLPRSSMAVITDETDTFANNWWSKDGNDSTSQMTKSSSNNRPSDEITVRLSKNDLGTAGLGLELSDIEFRTNRRVFVKSIRPGSLAERLGIKSDWIVVSINGQSTERTNAQGVSLMLQNVNEDAITFVFRDPFQFRKQLDNLGTEKSVTTQVAPAGDTSQRLPDGSLRPGRKETSQTDQQITVEQLVAPRMCNRGARIDDLLEISYLGTVVETGQVFDGSAVKINGQGVPGRGDDVTLFFVLGKQPFGQFPPGWDTGLYGMCVGERRRLLLPPVLAYGSTGMPRRGIPPDATLQYDITLVSLNGLATPQQNAKIQ